MKALWISVAVVLVFSIWSSPAAQQRKFYPDDPLLVDDDTLDVPERPAEIELSDMFDHIAVDLGSTTLTEAENVNTLDEVPDSLVVHNPSWQDPAVDRGACAGTEHR